MKFLAYIFALVVLAQSLFLPQIASASISFDGPLQAEVPVRKIGFLLLAEGTALIKGEDIKVQARDDSSHMIQELLSGKILDKASDGSGNKSVLKGHAYFSAGAKLDSLEPHCSGESVDLNNGSKIAGHITDLTKEGLTIEPISGSAKHFAMSEISKIHSPKVFSFTIEPDAKGMVFGSTCVPTTSVVIHKTNKKKLALIVVAGVVIATGIACGVAIPLAVHHHHTAPQTPLLTFARPAPTPIVVPGTRFTIPVRQGVPVISARPRNPVITTVTVRPRTPATPTVPVTVIPFNRGSLVPLGI